MFNNLKISTKMLIMVVIPLAGMFLFAARDIAGKTANLRNLQATHILTEFAVQTGSLVHELQKERGLSAGFISTKGEKFREELAGQRNNTDSQIKELKGYISAKGGYLAGVNGRLGAADAMLAKLAATRGGVDGMKLEPQETLASYTQTISSFLDVIAQITIMSMNPDITREAMAYHAFLSVKEQTGLERAILNGIFATNSFDDKTYERYVGIAAAQATFLEVFTKFANAYHLKSFLKKMNAPFYQQVEAIRSTAMAKRLTGDFGIRPEDSFAAMSVMINVMKEMENQLAAHLGEKANSLADSARLSLILSAFTLAAATAASLIIGFIIMTGIASPLRNMAGELKVMANEEGALTKRLNTNRSDEIGEVSKSFNSFVDSIQSMVPGKDKGGAVIPDIDIG